MAESGEPAPETDEQSVHEVILGMLEADTSLDDAVKEAVLDALAEVEQSDDTQDEQALPIFLSGISVAGFRGIGPQARLTLYPAPGLMVVSGRNGSGKSSFAEALELALTGTSYRWHMKEVMWSESWQNLHRHNPCAIRIEFTGEGVGPFKIGIDWQPDAPLTDRSVWTQTGTGDRVEGTEGLGWARALEIWRPVLSYDELGRLFDGGPSALYDAMAKLLGLEALADAEKWLAAQLKSTRAAREQADSTRKLVQVALADSDDERAQQAIALLRKRPAPLDDLLSLATGSDGAALQVVPALRALTVLDIPGLDEIDAAATRLRAAAQAAAESASAVADTAAQRVDLLQAAVSFHEHAGDVDCPVCGQGRLDDSWAAQARDTINGTEAALAEYRSATNGLKQARSVASGLVTRLEHAGEIDGIAMSALQPYNDAVDAAARVPAGDAEVAGHLETMLVAAVVAADALRAEADAALEAMESTWAPLAAQLAAWVPLERRARDLDGEVKTMAEAKKWMTEHVGEFRNLRLKPVAAQARKIWAQLRQESNVDLGEITLEGSATRRRANLGGVVDGQPTKALSVMSQGELHALALALFLPRATAAHSPFRFVVLDDPIQAMDPAKIDGFVQVLTEIAQTHQVVVFSHDDRLASVIRETGVDARLVNVVRETGSKVSLHDNVTPAVRQVHDIFALIKDDGLADDVKAKVLPGLFRIALESAAKQAYYTKQSLAGSSRADAEQAWSEVKKTRQRLALAVLGDHTADLTGWLKGKPYRGRALHLCNAVHGSGTGVSMDDARDLERTVEEVLTLR